MKPTLIAQAMSFAVLAMGAVVSAFPFVWMLATALKPIEEAQSTSLRLIPSTVQWGNFPEALAAAPFATYFFNTFLVAGIVTGAVVLTALLAGYAFARLEFPGREALFIMLLATLMIPFELSLIPNFIIIRAFGWYDTYAALTVPWMANAFSIFLLRQALRTIPREYFDAARIDGCGHASLLVYTAAPLARPAMVAAALFAFLGSYNALLWPLVVTGSEQMRVVQVGLTVFMGGAGMQVNLLMAAAAVVMLPPLLLYFAAQRQFLDSALAAGLKS